MLTLHYSLFTIHYSLFTIHVFKGGGEYIRAASKYPEQGRPKWEF